MDVTALYFPDAVLVDRSAVEARPATDGSVFLDSGPGAAHPNAVRLPGLVLRPRPGRRHGRLRGDPAAAESSHPRGASRQSARRVEAASEPCRGDELRCARPRSRHGCARLGVSTRPCRPAFLGRSSRCSPSVRSSVCRWQRSRLPRPAQRRVERCGPMQDRHPPLLPRRLSRRPACDESPGQSRTTTANGRSGPALVLAGRLVRDAASHCPARGFKCPRGARPGRGTRPVAA
jgi:hypothetical protein